MKRLTLFTAAALIALSPAARADETDWPELRRLLERFSEDSRALLEDWLTELAPMLDSLQDRIDDLSNYEAPEVMPNGDIIIRRKPDAPDLPPPDPGPGQPPADLPQGQIEL